MSIEKFREAIVTPLRQTIEQHKNASLVQFRSRDDLTKQWDRAEGMEMSLNHIESTYNSLMNSTEPNVEIMPPQA